MLHRRGRSAGSAQPFPSLSHFSVLAEGKLQQGGLFTLKTAGNLKAGWGGEPPACGWAAAACSRYRHITWRFLSPHTSISQWDDCDLESTHVCAPTCGAVCVFCFCHFEKLFFERQCSVEDLLWLQIFLFQHKLVMQDRDISHVYILKVHQR